MLLAPRWLNPKGCHMGKGPKKLGSPSLPLISGGKWAAAELGEPSISAKSQSRLGGHFSERNGNETLVSHFGNDHCIRVSNSSFT